MWCSTPLPAWQDYTSNFMHNFIQSERVLYFMIDLIRHWMSLRSEWLWICMRLIVDIFLLRIHEQSNCAWLWIDPRNGTKNFVPEIDSIAMCISQSPIRSIPETKLFTSFRGVDSFIMSIYFVYIFGVNDTFNGVRQSPFPVGLKIINILYRGVSAIPVACCLSPVLFKV